MYFVDVVRPLTGTVVQHVAYVVYSAVQHIRADALNRQLQRRHEPRSSPPKRLAARARHTLQQK